MNKRDWLRTVAALLATAACERGRGGGQPEASAPSGQAGGFGVSTSFASTLHLDPDKPLHPANPALLGTNVQWVDGGDGLLPATGIQFVPKVLERVKQLAPTVIRYPGGSNSDVYHWQAGVGSELQRGSNEHFHRKEKQITRLGTAEFLALCETVGATPLITANVGTGTASEAAAWVRQTNITGLVSPMSGKRLPPVRYWEIGNEPYLKEEQRRETWMAPEEYARRANEFMRAMRAVDPAIRIGIPLRSDSFNGSIPVTPHQGFNRKVLPLLTEPFDFVALHNAYLPFLYDRVPEDEAIYAALMGASETVRSDLDATRDQLRALGRQGLPLAITEYNALVTIGKRQDAYLAAPAGALYVADLLRTFAEQPDMLCANHWSLIGNWEFGSLSSGGDIRPVFWVLSLYRAVLRGHMLAVRGEGKTFSSPGIGLMRPAGTLPAVAACATGEGGRVRLAILNKDPRAESECTVHFAHRRPAKLLENHQLKASAPFARPEAHAFSNQAPRVELKGDGLTAALPPASLTYLEVALG